MNILEYPIMGFVEEETKRQIEIIEIYSSELSFPFVHL